MKNTNLAVALIVVGLLVNNFAYLHDLIVNSAPVIWMGPKTWVLAALGALAVVVGAWMAIRRQD
jgi:hypothetical protein